ncbi:MAG: hypothetical protein EA392_01020 [Cryomorphaceae bacterium]|nr:MAG: hypothetical protein EA392_01020 [Cryomorphaceae bacterium]
MRVSISFLAMLIVLLVAGAVQAQFDEGMWGTVQSAVQAGSQNGGKKVFPDEVNDKLKSKLAHSTEGKARYTVESPRKVSFKAFERKHAAPRIFQVLAEGEGYVLLCLSAVEHPCDCKGDLYIYTAKRNRPYVVERPLLFSMRKSLVREINEWGEYALDEEQFHNYCEVMEWLIQSDEK